MAQKRTNPTKDVSLSYPFDTFAAIAACDHAAALVYAECKAKRRSKQHIVAVTRRAWVAALPTITSRSEAAVYIATVAHGIQVRGIDTLTAKPLLYAAQLALAAFPTR